MLITTVPLLDLQAQYATLKSEIEVTVHEVLESQYFIMGPNVSKFEKEVGTYCNSEFAYGCASGSDALLLALMAIDIKPGDYVLTSPFTFFATGGAIDRLGAIPVFIDIDPVTFNIDAAKVRSFLDNDHPLREKFGIDPQKIKAIIPVHLYGQMAEMDALVELAEEFDLKIIEDAAQSIGSIYKGVQAGNFGDFGCFSFFPSKNLGAYGDAGLITVKDAELASKVDILRLHGARPKYHHKYVGINSRLDAIQAAILSVKLKYLDEWSQKRREIALRYNQLFTEAGLISDSNATALEIDKLITPKEVQGNPENGGRHIYHQYTIRVKNRDELADALTKAGIGNAVYYPLPLHVQECFSDLGYTPEDCPEAMLASEQALSLPIYPELKEEQVNFVVQTVTHFLQKR